MTQKTNRQWILARRPQGTLRDGDLELREAPVPDLGEGQILIRTLYLSLDPTNRVWMNDMDTYLPAMQLGEPMRGLTMGVVEASTTDKFAAGDIVMPALGVWAEYTIADASAATPVATALGAPLPAYLSVLGMTGLTAYFGMTDIAKAKAGETAVISGAAGAVGSIAGQIGKILGLRVVGIAGSEEKCAWLTDELGFDGAINYKTDAVEARLAALCPEGVDVYFENVGGPILDAVLGQMNTFGRIAVCGLISGYNAEKPQPGPYRFGNIIMKRLTVQGFIILDYTARYGEGVMALAGWLNEGKLHYKVDIVDGLEQAPAALNKLFTGENKGKLMVRVSPEP